jgi:STE24 endopeptidase
MNTFSIVFIVFLGATLATQLWLARRQIRHVLANRNSVPGSFAGKISQSAHEKAADYTVSKNRLSMIDEVYGAALLLIWTLGGGLQFLDSSWNAANLGPIWHGTAVLLSLFLIGGLLELPFSVYNTFVVEERFGFNKTDARTFVIDMFKNTGLMLLIGGPLLFAVLWIMSQMGGLWWLYVWVLISAFNLFAIWAYPTWIAPLFNKFKPLEEGSVRDRVQSLLERTGFRSKGIFVMDGSKRSAHGNAYFTGFGRNKRIVFFDTLLNSLNESEVEAVLAHELGHFKLKHITKRIVVMFALSLAGLALLGWLANQAWFYHGLGIASAPGQINHLGLALFLLAMPVFTFFLSPLMSWSSRKHEFEADAFASQQADARDLISALVKMYEENAKTLTPDPLHSIFYDSHPPAPVRIAHLQEQQT